MKTIPLTPVDYVFTGVGSQPITFAFYFSKKINLSAFKKSLDEALDAFSILRSQMRRLSDQNYEYVLREDGYTFEVVETERPFEELGKVTDYITPVSSLEGFPLTKIQLTQTPNGSVLGVSISHALVDGFSYFYFLVSWANICRGESFFKPYLKRDVVLSHLKSKEEIIESDKLYSDCGLFFKEQSRESLDGFPDMERFLISAETIDKHIKKGKQRFGISLTKNDVITAQLWKKYLLLWNNDRENSKTYLTCPFDFRRTIAGFPPNYFGCALCFTAVSIDQKNLENYTIEKLGVLIRQSVNKIKSDFVLKSLNTLETFRLQNGLTAMEKIHLRHPKHGMIITNLTRMPLKNIDFGSGPPDKFLAYVEVHSSAAILPADNGVEILIVKAPGVEP